MRIMIGNTAATLMLASAALLAAAPAFAGADDGETKAFWSDQGSSAQNGRYVASSHTYMKMDPRDAKADPNAGADVDANNPYFNHAKGTETADPSANYAATSGQNGRYVASYHQYMTMDPRDAKVDSNARKDVDGNNPYFFHNKGTESMP